MAIPSTRQTLISYAKRALGHPVIEINVDDDQVDDRIDDALLGPGDDFGFSEGLEFFQDGK